MNTTTNQTAITVITTTIAMLAVMCVGTMCYLAIIGTEIPRSLDLLTGGLVGALTAMLVKTSPTETQKQPQPPPPPPPISNANPLPVTVENKPADPVPTVEAEK